MAFQYSIRDSLGKVHSGQIDATTIGDARQQLAHNGSDILTLVESVDEFTLLSRRITKKEIIFISSQLAIMVDTGITLAAALEGIIRQEQNPTLRKLLTELKNDVESGKDFSAALEKHPKHFDKMFVALIKASEATGSMGPMLERTADYLRKEVEARSKIRASMAYPMVMMFVALGVTIFLLTFVLPKFTPLFNRKGVELPRITVIMMGVSGNIIENWIIWIASILIFIGAIIYSRRSETGRNAWDWLKINIPIIGPVSRKVIISRSIRTLGTMVTSGVSVLDALKLSAEVSGNIYFERLWKNCVNQVAGGKQICESLANHPLFPPMLVQMISSGEQTGKLGEVLDKVSHFYDREVEDTLKTTTSLIEPLLICAMGGVVGTIALSLLLPIFSLSRTPG